MPRNAGSVTDRNGQASDGRSGGNGGLERVTVNLIPRASRALKLAATLTGDTKTDSINRAIQIYAYLEQITAEGGAIYVRESVDGELERLKLFG